MNYIAELEREKAFADGQIAAAPPMLEFTRQQCWNEIADA